MPQVFERGDTVASLRVVGRERHGRYRCSCYRCKRTVSVAGSSMRCKKVNCQHCYPNRKALPSQVFYDRKGWAEVAA